MDVLFPEGFEEWKGEGGEPEADGGDDGVYPGTIDIYKPQINGNGEIGKDDE